MLWLLRSLSVSTVAVPHARRQPSATGLACQAHLTLALGMNLVEIGPASGACAASKSPPQRSCASHSSAINRHRCDRCAAADRRHHEASVSLQTCECVVRRSNGLVKSPRVGPAIDSRQEQADGWCPPASKTLRSSRGAFVRSSSRPPPAVPGRRRRVRRANGVARNAIDDD